jgi:hypothetical protein
VSEPTLAVRKQTYRRDGFRCISCGAWSGLQYQHRRAEGMGGRAARPGMVDGLTSCALCNPGYEGALQRVALKHGWKVRSWVSDRSRVPVWYALERCWYRLAKDGSRERVSRSEAMGMMRDVYGPAWDDEKGLVY